MSKVGEGTIRRLPSRMALREESQIIVHDDAKWASIPRKKGRLMPPIHPGEFLREDFLLPLRMTAKMLADEIKVPERRMVAIVKERRGLDADLCLRLARYFRMTPQFWMNMQRAFELETAMKDWPRICKDVRVHPTDRKTGALKASISEKPIGASQGD
jgi:antitoxin HigA-1